MSNNEIKAPRELDINEIEAVSGGTESSGSTSETTVNKAKMSDKAYNAMTEYLKS